MEKQSKTPILRFPSFSSEWKKSTINEIAEVTSGGTPSRTNKEYWNGQIPWVSTSLIDFNIISKTDESITEQGLKNSSAKLFSVGTVLMAMYGQGKTRGKVALLGIEATTNQACAAIITNNEVLNSNFLFQNLSNRYDEIRNLSNQGGQQNLSGGIIKGIEIYIPELLEQNKVSSFFSLVDEKLKSLRKKKDLLEEYKKGVVQKLFSQEIRFKDENGTLFPDWTDRKLGDVLHEHKLKSTGTEDVFSVSVHKGLINQIEHLGRSFAASSTDHYNLVQPNDIVYTKSPTGDFPLGIIKQSKIDKNVIVSPLYGIFTPESKGLGYLLNVHFESPINTANYLGSLIQKGAKNTINITNLTFLSKEMKLPTSIEEQNKIGDFLEAIDKKITELGAQIDNVETWKKGLLQKMFC